MLINVSTPTEFIIIADLPGVEKDNLSVDITNESVTITVTFPKEWRVKNKLH